jgi:hypothetical protein
VDLLELCGSLAPRILGMYVEPALSVRVPDIREDDSRQIVCGFRPKLITHFGPS